MKPAKPAMALLAFSVSMAGAMILAALVIRFVLEQADRAWTEEVLLAGPGEADPVSPGDISALLEEARRITRETEL